MNKIGHRGIQFWDKSGATGEFSLVPNLKGKMGKFVWNVGGDRRTNTEQAFALLEAGDKNGCLKLLSSLYDKVEEQWIPADHSMLNVSMRPQQFDVVAADL